MRWAAGVALLVGLALLAWIVFLDVAYWSGGF